MSFTNNNTLSTKFYSDLLDTLDTGLLIYERDSKRVIYANRALLSTIGYSFDEIVGRTYHMLIDPEDRKFVAERETRITKREDVTPHFILKLVGKNKEKIFGLFKARDFNFGNKEYRLVIAENLSKNPVPFVDATIVTSLLTFLSEYSNIGFWVDDLNNNTLYVNKFFQNLLGFNEKEILDKRVTDFLTPESQKRYIQVSNQRKKGQKTSTYELTLLNKYGRPIPFRVIGGQLTDHDGNLIGSVGIFISIEELTKLNLLLSKINSYVLLYSTSLEEFWERAGDDLIELFNVENVRIVVENKVVYNHGEQAILVSDSELLERLVKNRVNLLRLDKDSTPKILENFSSAIIGLISLEQQPIGYILLSSKIRYLFTENDERLFQSYCTQISMIYHYKELYSQLQDEREFYFRLFSILSHDFVNSITSLDGYINYILHVIDSQTEFTKPEEWPEIELRTKNLLERTSRIMTTVQQLTKIRTEAQLRMPVSLKAAIDHAAETIKILEKREINLKIKIPSRVNVLAGNLLQNAFEYIFYRSLSMSPDLVEPSLEISVTSKGDEVLCEIIDHHIKFDFVRTETVLSELKRGDKRFQDEVGLNLYLAKKIIEAYEGKFVIKPLNEKTGYKIQIILPRG